MSVQVNNNAPSSFPASSLFTDITVAGAPSNVTNYCPQGQQIPNHTMSPTTNARYSTSNLAGTSTYWVVRIEIPSTLTTAGRRLASMSFAETGGSPIAFRQISFSKNICDFTATSQNFAYFTNSGFGEVAINDNNPNATVKLTTGTWYMVVNNQSCAANVNCDIYYEWRY